MSKMGVDLYTHATYTRINTVLVFVTDKAKLVDQFSTTSAADIVPCNHAKLDSR